MPYARYGNLLEALSSPQFSQMDKRSLLARCAKPIALLHEHEVVIMDIKPENILVTESDCMILDLGLAVHNQPTFSHRMGNAYYRSPERWDYLLHPDRHQKDPREKIDCYAFGLLIDEILQHPKKDRQPLPWLKKEDLERWKRKEGSPIEEYRTKYEEYQKTATSYQLKADPLNLEGWVAWLTHPDPECRPSMKKVLDFLTAQPIKE